ncbi:type II toxin-antitoxin system VapC family toxin [Nostoc sp. CHAB 5834]|nr:type II toxin-antitoxin system VapC family toxin [Nostoc sp. CHAB 5834]
MWILDTDHVSLFQNSHPLVTQRIRQQNSPNLAITVITFEEKVKGWLNVINKYSNQPSKYDKLIWGYKGLWDEIEYFKNMKLLEFDTKACNIYAELVKQKIRIGTQDLRIAAITLSVNGILVTRNRKDFEKVPNLRLEDWTIS